LNILNAIPLSATLIICSLMSYWHGNNKNGMRKFGLIYTIILGTAATILVVGNPMF
jgi:hypothetical protein